eukprot:m.335805 g.335805  ORF g.335805 m.335805 type:complete len:230 (+) comp17679_c0_seq1:90-779(+)
MFQSVKLSLLVILAVFNVVAVAAFGPNSCGNVQPRKTLNTTEFIRRSWYSRQQQITGYQTEEQLYCVTQTLALEGKTVPFFSGTVISVYNYANNGAANGPNENDANKTILCARQTDPSSPAAIINAPCFLPNFLAGDYWVIAAGPSDNNYQWAIISGGPPTVHYPNNKCTTKTTGTNGAGLWLFTRSATGQDDDITTMRSVLTNLNYTLKELKNVTQAGCQYHGAYIKN